MNPKDNIKKEKRVQARKPVISSACNLPEVRRHLDKNFGCSLLVLKEMEILISAQDLNFTQLSNCLDRSLCLVVLHVQMRSQEHGCISEHFLFVRDENLVRSYIIANISNVLWQEYDHKYRELQNILAFLASAQSRNNEYRKIQKMQLTQMTNSGEFEDIIYSNQVVSIISKKQFN